MQAIVKQQRNGAIKLPVQFGILSVKVMATEGMLLNRIALFCELMYSACHTGDYFILFRVGPENKGCFFEHSQAQGHRENKLMAGTARTSLHVFQRLDKKLTQWFKFPAN